mmetsp:Transcript_41019/g.30169  ORF Transcript_41019/g.30169 Transcript_41019/m.30169 type:complete len:132 (+) Transcript_41019:312-707(+)|eukprot:CAMPEP_0202962122 /NCGR_PEP_ID=MMETSP1396-20130829/6230_1 /ASSEMBLY_ACC=CAM_ASM_000872 /TAXON_ID= /ORGANISM="Pseudokeronopsis sp., Strain Brazil" /LENGTH=131 /DNA_ID=CAMNT_0049682495 /DNA_START=292 /DNA_END=687 /DNA_ORIENTATION=-
MPGDYAFPFSFQVPAGLPSSLIYKNNDLREKPKAKIKYSVRTTLLGHGGEKHMSYKKVLLIRQTPPELLHDIARTGEKEIKSFCCINQGISRLSVIFDKNIFEPNEVSKVKIQLDNKGCNIDMRNVTFKLE